MPLFEFNQDTQSGPNSGTNASVSFTDQSVNFTVSTSSNGGVNQITYSPVVGGDGQISISDFTGGNTWTLDVTNGASNFSGNLALKLGSSISGAWQVVFVGTNGNVTSSITTLFTSTTLSVSQGGTNEFTSIKFIPTSVGGSGGNYLTLDSLNTSIVCYLEGTGIETPKGRVAVEDLSAGDKIVTADGGVTTVRWVGEQPVDTASVTPAKTFPICFKAGAIAPGVPVRDLYVSPDHAMDIGGVLINASALVNGRSITQAQTMPQEGFTYYHIDTGAHELILAEGAASETYLDLVGREVFINGHEMADAPMIPEMAKPRIVARRMVPRNVMDQLEARADALGFGKVARVA